MTLSKNCLESRSAIIAATILGLTLASSCGESSEVDVPEPVPPPPTDDREPGRPDVHSGECPCGLGDLVIRDLLLPETIILGESTEITWSTCYIDVCGNDSGESGRVIEQMKISSPGGGGARLTTFEDIPTIQLGDCVSRSTMFPGRLPVGTYRVTIRLDPTGQVAECEHASQKNERASVYVKVVDPEER